ncbi:MAG: UPF0158 family protein [Planctomycetota bacterium]
MTSLSLDDLRGAYYFISWGSPGDNAAYVCRRTGEIYWSGDAADLDEVPEDADDPERYAFVPDKATLELGARLLRDFAAAEMPKLFDRIEEIFRSAGAYARFKELLDREGRLDDWYAFEERREVEALRAWCVEEGFEVVEGRSGEGGSQAG